MGPNLVSKSRLGGQAGAYQSGGRYLHSLPFSGKQTASKQGFCPLNLGVKVRENSLVSMTL